MDLCGFVAVSDFLRSRTGNCSGVTVIELVRSADVASRWMKPSCCAGVY